MCNCAHLGTSEGDAMEVRFQPKPTWGPDGYKGRWMAGRESYYNYGSNILIGVKLSKHRQLPSIILSEIVSFYTGINYGSGGVNRQQYNLAHINENNYLVETDNEIIISSVHHSGLALKAEKQYINFTLVYSSFRHEHVVPLIDPISGSCFFQMSLHYALANNQFREETWR